MCDAAHIREAANEYGKVAARHISTVLDNEYFIWFLMVQ